MKQIKRWTGARAVVIGIAAISSMVGTSGVTRADLLPYSPSEFSVSSSFNIVLNPDAGLSSNTSALSAFQRAAQQWVSRIVDPITVYINAGLAAMGGSTIGTAASFILEAGYDTIRNQMVVDATDEPSNAIVAALPTQATFRADYGSGPQSVSSIVLTKANAKAMGFTGLDAAFGQNDGTITFNSNFAFDYDNSDGVGAGLMDFETVAAHEIGHVLGFISQVDAVDAGATPAQAQVSTLDLFRFTNNQAGRDPATLADFATYTRDMRPGVESMFDDLTNEYLLSTGVNQGDGNQASHFKDNLNLGLLDPTLAFGEVVTVSTADLRVMDVIGYDVAPATNPVPEPGTWAMMGVGLLGMVILRRRKKSAAIAA